MTSIYRPVALVTILFCCHWALAAEDEFNVEVAEQKILDSTTVKALESLIKKQEKIQKFRFEKWQLNPILAIIRTIFHEIFLLRINSIFCHIDCKGKENLAMIKEPVIFMSNHQSAFDVPFLVLMPSGKTNNE